MAGTGETGHVTWDRYNIKTLCPTFALPCLTGTVDDAILPLTMQHTSPIDPSVTNEEASPLSDYLDEMRLRTLEICKREATKALKQARINICTVILCGRPLAEANPVIESQVNIVAVELQKLRDLIEGI